MTTKTDTKMAWEAVADRIDSLGLKLQVHLEQAGPANEMTKAFERLGAAIESTFSAVGGVVQDPAIRKDAVDLASALRDALADTLSRAGEEVAAATNGLRCHGAASPGKVPQGPAE